MRSIPAWRRESCSFWISDLSRASTGSLMYERWEGFGISMLVRVALCGSLQLSNPDIAISYRIAVILKLQRCLGSVRDVKRRTVVIRVTVDLYIVLNEHSVVQHSDSSAFDDSAIFIKLGRREDDVIALPLTRFPGNIDQRRILFVNRARLTVVVGLVVVRIQHLHFIPFHQKHAAVAALLTLAFYFGRSRPFDV